MKITTIISALEELAPPAYAENFDNVGLLIGHHEQTVHKALVCIDCLEIIVDEAIAIGADLIICFHPIVFSGLKRFNGTDYVQRVVIKAIQNKIAIYALHTNLDFAWGGSNHALAEKLGLKNLQVLIPKEKSLKKITTYIPIAYTEKVKQALFEAGGGTIGQYDECSFTCSGLGSFRPNISANPFAGIPDEKHQEAENMLQMVFPYHLEQRIIKALMKSHPYETPAYEIFTLDNPHPEIGIGISGILEQEIDEIVFLDYLKQILPTDCIRHSALRNKPIKKVALLGGSGSFGLAKAKAVEADAYISADFKYHEFYMAEGQLLICDVGHYECEQHIKSHLMDYLSKKISNFAFVLSQINTNPINYK